MMGKNSKRSKTELHNNNGSSTSTESDAGTSSIGSNDTNLILKAIEKSLEVLSNRFEKQEQSILKLENTLSDMRNQINQQAENIVKLNHDNIQLQKEISNLKEYHQKSEAEHDKTKADINEINQDKLMKDILITNLPINNNFSTTQIVEKVFQILNCDVGSITKQYSVLHNKTAFNTNFHHINISFTHESAKENFLKRKKDNGPIFWQQILPHSLLTDDNKLREIYVNEKLTYYNLELLREARKKQKTAILKYAWHQRGSVLIRKTEGGAIMKIRSLIQLEEICSTLNE
jgi:hypothetical protein